MTYLTGMLVNGHKKCEGVFVWDVESLMVQILHDFYPIGFRCLYIDIYATTEQNKNNIMFGKIPESFPPPFMD